MLLSFDPESLTVKAGIRELLSFGWLPDDLFRVVDDAPLPLRQAVHSAWQRSTSRDGSRLEVPVSLTERYGKYTFVITGRADLVSEIGDALEVTEVKTVQGLRRDIDPVVDHTEYVLQLYFYFLALASASPDRQITTRLVFLDLDTSPPAERAFTPDPADPRIASAWNSFLAGIATWLDAELDLRMRQKEGLAGFRIPFEDIRPGQAEMAGIASESVRSASTALVEAPTGTGKTAAVLAGALPAALENQLTLFFLTSKDTQKRIVLETLHRFEDSGLPLRGIFITAREKACIAGVPRCIEEDCPYAIRFGSRIREHDLLQRLLAQGVIDPDLLIAAAAEAGVCPFELSLVLSLHCDAVVCDYNYVFDPHVYLRRFFTEPSSAAKCALLVDEAANLPPRSREYYSPEIRKSWLDALRPMPKDLRRFTRLITPWRKAFAEWEETCRKDGETEWELSRMQELPLREDSWKRAFDNLGTKPPEALLSLFVSIRDFSRIGASPDSRFHLVYRREREDSVLQWLCTDASAFLAERFETCHSACAFSATLKPLDHFRQSLGLPRETSMVELPYPFPEDRLGVWIDPRVDTRYRSRASSLPLLVKRVSGIYEACPGTYLVFFPSYEYLAMASEPIRRTGLPVMVQKPSMSRQERQDFLAKVECTDNLVLTVSGGIFAEGVDLRAPTRRGAIVVGPCLPIPELRNRLLAERHQSLGEDGFLHAMVIPAMNRVIQAAGRLIRGPDDYGALILMDRRFCQEPFLDLLPRHWFRDGSIQLLSDGMSELAEFWSFRDGRGGSA
jgi:DNA excision repair protein ERCC-2